MSGLPTVSSALHVESLDPAERELHGAILSTLQPVIDEKKQDGSAIVMTWEQLYAPLSPKQRVFLDAFRALRGETLGATSHYFGEVTDVELVPVGPQVVNKADGEHALEPQFLPRPAFDAYGWMMAAMQHDLGKRLLVESGYRSPAYQTYLFLFFMPKHGYSIRETNRFVALPGHSEHGYPPRQAIDFMNEDGVNGEDHPEEFEALPEYAWLQAHANTYSFFLSYPRDNALHTAFEPWHWHFEQ